MIFLKVKRIDVIQQVTDTWQVVTLLTWFVNFSKLVNLLRKSSEYVPFADRACNEHFVVSWILELTLTILVTAIINILKSPAEIDHIDEYKGALSFIPEIKQYWSHYIEHPAPQPSITITVSPPSVEQNHSLSPVSIQQQQQQQQQSPPQSLQSLQPRFLPATRADLQDPYYSYSSFSQPRSLMTPRAPAPPSFNYVHLPPNTSVYDMTQNSSTTGVGQYYRAGDPQQSIFTFPPVTIPNNPTPTHLPQISTLHQPSSLLSPPQPTITATAVPNEPQRSIMMLPSPSAPKTLMEPNATSAQMASRKSRPEPPFYEEIEQYLLYNE